MRKVFVDRWEYSHMKLRAFMRKQVGLGTVNLIKQNKKGFLYEVLDDSIKIPKVRR